MNGPIRPYPLPLGEGRVRVSGFAEICTLTRRFAPTSPRGRGSGPQCIRRSRRVLPLFAAAPEEIRPVRIGHAVVARWKRSGFRGAIDSCEHSLTSLLDLPEQRIDVPPDEFALPEHDLSRDQHVANVPWIHHRHNRARYIVYRPGINAPRVEHDDVGFFAGHESTDFVEQPSGRRTGDGGHLDDLP